MRYATLSGLTSVCTLALALSGCASLLTDSDDARSPIYSKLRELDRSGRPVSVAVLCEASTSLSFENIVILGYDQRTWPQSLCVAVQGKVEERLLEAFGRSKGFRLVDRELLPSVLAEQRLSLSGLVGEGGRLQPGQMAGATHLLVVEENIHGTPGLLDDVDDGIFGERRRSPRVTRTQRLIEAQSGTVLATEQREL